MPIIHIDLGDLAGWITAVATIIAVVLGLQGLKTAIATLRQMKEDTNQTLKHFEVENRAYLALHETISTSEFYNKGVYEIAEWYTKALLEGKEIANGPNSQLIKGAFVEHQFIDITFEIKNYGNIPTFIRSMYVKKNGTILNDESPAISIFPNSTREITLPIYVKRFHDVGAFPYGSKPGFLKDYDVIIQYYKPNGEDLYKYECAGDIDFLSEMFQIKLELFDAG